MFELFHNIVFICIPQETHLLHLTQILKGSQQQGTLVHFSLLREKREEHNFWQFSKYVDFSCTNEQDMFENSEFRRFYNAFTV